MISKRGRRSTGPQENLKQFSLNNSKGVDETKPIIDPNTVLYMKNLTVNLDGSLSLRKPMKAHKTINGLTTNNIFLMFTEKHYLVFDETPGIVGFKIVDEEGASCDLTFEVQDYYTNELTTFKLADNETRKLFDVSAASCINTADSTVIGNSYIYAETFSDPAKTSVIGVADFTVVDQSLYDEFGESSKLPRYIQITQSEDSENTFKVAIKTPEINTLTTAEGEPSLNPNMTLDNPYAIRDVYNSTYAQISGIMFYEHVYDSESPLYEWRSNSDSIDTKVSLYTKESSKILQKESASVGFVQATLPQSVLTFKAFHDGGNLYVQPYLLGIPVVVDFPKEITIKFGYYVNKNYVKLFEYTYTPNLDKAQVIPVTLQSGSIYTLKDAAETLGVGINDFVVDSVSEILYTYKNVYCTSTYPFQGYARVKHVTENVNRTDVCNFKPVSAISDVSNHLIKIFCKFPTGGDYWMVLEYLENGSWISAPISGHKLIVDSDAYGTIHSAINASLMNYTRPDNEVMLRADVIHTSLLDLFNIIDKTLRVRIVHTSAEYSAMDTVLVGKVTKEFAVYEFSIPQDASSESLETNLPNAVLGEKYYYKKAIYSYGDRYSGVVHVSNPGSFITPLYNVLEIGASAKSIPNSIVPWRNYIITFTENDVSLSSKTDTGFYTKTISTSVGVPFSDRKCPKAALNGIIFKSGRFVYFAYPNLYSGDDTALTLTNISRPIQSVLDSLSPNVECFAEVVDDTYLLMVPDSEEHFTLCLRYSLTDKHWEIYEYPVRFLKFLKSNYAGAVMYGVFKNGGKNTYRIFSISESGEAYDICTVDSDEAPVLTQPIAFMLDTGQKTDSISNTKQFVESKIVFATLDDKDAFPFTTYVAIDGDPHVHTMDVFTDAPFWKSTNPNSTNPVLGVLGTSFGLGGEETPASGKFNTLRQLVIRYSGKGKSIRHVIEGESQCNFKLYETYIRYKNLNGK